MEIRELTTGVYLLTEKSLARKNRDEPLQLHIACLGRYVFCYGGLYTFCIL